jgi:heme/copper-type cytochrome/quinol oxidase subunit 4
MEQTQPKNYLIESILATIFCCFPFGIPAIIYASQANSKFAIGDFEGAQKASKNAKNWTIWSVVIGVIVIVSTVIIPFLFLGGAIWESF